MGDRRCGSVVAGLGEIGDGRARLVREEWRRKWIERARDELKRKREKKKKKKKKERKLIKYLN